MINGDFGKMEGGEKHASFDIVCQFDPQMCGAVARTDFHPCLITNALVFSIRRVHQQDIMIDQFGIGRAPCHAAAIIVFQYAARGEDIGKLLTAFLQFGRGFIIMEHEASLAIGMSKPVNMQDWCITAIGCDRPLFAIRLDIVPCNTGKKRHDAADFRQHLRWIIVPLGISHSVHDIADNLSVRPCSRARSDRRIHTLNTAVVVRSAADRLVPAVLAGLDRAAAALGTNAKLHVVGDAADVVGRDRFDQIVGVSRAEGVVDEAAAERIDADQLGHEWEWEASPEITLVLVDSIDDAVERFNALSPRFAASLISDDEREQNRFWSTIDAPFVGDGFTRWVDGQYALDRPELGLSNWQFGRLFARGGVLAGDSVFTVRSRVRQSNANLHR